MSVNYTVKWGEKCSKKRIWYILQPESKNSTEGVPLVPVEFGDEWCTLNFKTAASARLSRGRWKVLVIAGMIHGTDGLCSISGLF